MRDELLESGLAWSELQRNRRAIRERFPTIWSLRVVKNASRVIAGNIWNGARLLDIGAYDRHLESRLRRSFPDIVYRSMDPDRNRFHDYYRLEDIQESFHVIALLEVIEHLSLEEGIELLRRASRLLHGEGLLIVSTPNLYHPHRFWDVSHKTPYRYDDLGGILLSLGFQVKGIYRVYNAPFLSRGFRLYLAAPIHRYLDIDFARSILAIGCKAPQHLG